MDTALDRVYVPSDKGLFVTSNEGADWERLYHGLSYVQVSCVACGPGDTVYCGTAGGPYRSTDRGENWTLMVDGWPTASVDAFLALSDGALLASAEDPSGQTGSVGLFRSIDNGMHWTKIDSGLLGISISALMQQENGAILAGSSGSILRSSDDGLSWQMTYQSPYHYTIEHIKARSESDIFAVGDGIFLSSFDSGKTWTYHFGPFWWGDAFTFIDDSTIVVISDVPYRSTNNGVTWQSADSTTGPRKIFEWLNGVAVDSHGKFFVGNIGGLTESTDGGRSWFAGASPYSGNGAVYVDYISPDDQIIIHQNPSFHAPMYHSPDDGKTWDSISAPPASGVWFDKAGIMYINGWNGLFRSQESILTAVRGSTNFSPTSFQLRQNYPNPFNPATNFRFQIAEFRFVTLKIYNLLGQEVATLVNGWKGPGEYSVTWNAGNNASGIYFYKISAGKFTDVKKMLLLR